MNNRFEYFLNATHYCLWLGHIKFGSTVRCIVNIMFSPIPKYCFTAEYKKKFYKHKAKQQTEINKFLYDKKTGHHITHTNHCFGYLYSCYPGFFSFILGGIAIKEIVYLNVFLCTIIYAIPVGIGYIPAYKAVFANDRYLKYFKQFEKEDEQWHRKWKRITIFFCIGAIVSSVLGICAAFAIAILL